MAKPKLKIIKRTWEDGYKKKPKIDLSRQINRMAQIVVKETKDGINSGKDIDGAPFKPLKKSTIKAKKEKGSKFPTTILKDTGLMQKIYLKKRASEKKQRAIVSIAKLREEIGFKHNVGKGVPEREWFGVGFTIKQKLDKYIKAEMKRLLKIR